MILSLIDEAVSAGARLAKAAQIVGLCARTVIRWRMVEHWFQIELFRAAQSGKAGIWQHVGIDEKPYHSNLPRSGSKTNTKWIDLVCFKHSQDYPPFNWFGCLWRAL